jgi:uncharacterized repeat protein (TIGR03843 family)
MSSTSEPDELTAPLAMVAEDALELLCVGEISVEGRLVDASNATLYCGITSAGVSAACVYKPVAGERPLWDFPDGTLAEREVAAHVVSEALGWSIVPPTVYRADGPAGPGMVQLWIAEDETADIVRMIRRRDSEALRRIAIFDAVINNADRKGGHLLPTSRGHVYGIDHGVSFHADDKLRTVLWQWAGRELPGEVDDDLRELRSALDGALGEALAELLTTREVRQTRRRLDRLILGGTHPEPSDDWPAVPWPPM